MATNPEQPVDPIAPPEIPDNLLSIHEAAAIGGVSVDTLYRWIRKRGLNRVRVPGYKVTFVDRDQLAELLKPELR
jgi:excisionase family DNA binding protein